MAFSQVLFLLTAVSILVSACSEGSADQVIIDGGTIPSTSTLPALRQVSTATAIPTKLPPTVTVAPATETSQPTATIIPSNTPTSSPTPIPPPTVTPAPTVTPLPTATPEAKMTRDPTTPPVAVVDSKAINGVSVQEFVILPATVRDNVRRIALEGQQIGRNAHAFSKLGDSVTLTDHFLTRFDSGHYNLGPYSYLQPAIDYYSGSFSRYGVATKIGLHAWSIFDPLWADKDWCLPDENILACEIRLHNPSVLLVKIGSNDSGAASHFEANMRDMLDYSISSGVIPILATKADRFEGPDDRNNRIIRQLAQEYAVPLWDYDRIAGTLPRRGLSGDDVHMTMADGDDYTKPETFERGYPVSDLSALMTLYEVMLEVRAAGDA